MENDVLDVYREGDLIVVDTGDYSFDLTKEETMWFIAALATAAASEDDVSNNELLN